MCLFALLGNAKGEHFLEMLKIFLGYKLLASASTGFWLLGMVKIEHCVPLITRIGQKMTFLEVFCTQDVS